MATKTLPPTQAALTERSSELNYLDKVLLILGAIAVAVFAVASYLYTPSMQETAEAARLAMLPEHVKVCEQLGKVEASERATCVKLLDELQITHKHAFMADASDI